MDKRLEKLLVWNNLGKGPEEKRFGVSEKRYCGCVPHLSGQIPVEGKERFFPIAFGIGLFELDVYYRGVDPQMAGVRRKFYRLGERSDSYVVE